MADKVLLLPDGRGRTRQVKLVERPGGRYAIATSTDAATESFLVATGLGETVPLGLVDLGDGTFAISVSEA